MESSCIRGKGLRQSDLERCIHPCSATSLLLPTYLTLKPGAKGTRLEQLECWMSAGDATKYLEKEILQPGLPAGILL